MQPEVTQNHKSDPGESGEIQFEIGSRRMRRRDGGYCASWKVQEAFQGFLIPQPPAVHRSSQLFIYKRFVALFLRWLRCCQTGSVRPGGANYLHSHMHPCGLFLAESILTVRLPPVLRTQKLVY